MGGGIDARPRSDRGCRVIDVFWMSTIEAVEDAATLRMARRVLLNCMVGLWRRIEWEGRGGEKTTESWEEVGREKKDERSLLSRTG